MSLFVIEYEIQSFPAKWSRSGTLTKVPKRADDGVPRMPGIKVLGIDNIVRFVRMI